MNIILPAFIAIAAYASASVALALTLGRAQPGRVATGSAWVALVAHLVNVAMQMSVRHGFIFSFFSSASLVAAIVAALLLLASLGKPVLRLGLFLFPIAALMLGLDLIFDHPKPHVQVYGWGMTCHILASVVAYSLLNIAALQAMLLQIQDQHLKSHPPKRFVQSLPSLQTMEVLLFQMIAVGLGFLTVSLATGFAFVEDLFAQHLVHKTVLSMLAWLIFTGLLLGRKSYGWRGKTAIQWTVAGFVLLLLAYFGSKFVLELLLHR